MASQSDTNEYQDLMDTDVPLHALRYTCTERMSWYLNKQVQLRPGMRHAPNFGGLAELIGLDGVLIAEMSRRENPALAILESWKERRNLNPTIGNFVKYLHTLGRVDILTDNADWIREEIKAHHDRQQKLEIQVETVSSGSAVVETDKILTIDDVREGVAIYDAFVCYDNADVDFVKAMIAKLEAPEYGFRFFVPSRNNLGGTNSNALTTRIISERCRHMIVVLSRSFLQSPACEFQSGYAFALNPGARDKKIVPIKIEDCQTPDILKIMAFCDFTNPALLDWSWTRLAMSIMGPMPNPDFLGPLQFKPVPGSCLYQDNLGLSELAPRGRASRNDSGFSSLNSQQTRGPATAPVHRSNQTRRSSPPTASAHHQTAPVRKISPSLTQTKNLEEKRVKSPSSMSQALKRFTQRKKPKMNTEMKPTETCKSEATEQGL